MFNNPLNEVVADASNMGRFSSNVGIHSRLSSVIASRDGNSGANIKLQVDPEQLKLLHP